MTVRLRSLPPVRRLLAVLLAVLLAGLAVGCTGGSGDSAAALGDRLSAAKRTLDGAASIDLTLRTDRLPPGVDGITEAAGVATHAPAFRGQITVAAGGLFDGQQVDVVAVDGDVYAQTPFSSSYLRVDPADFNAPDPATLLDPDTGLSTLLSEATDLSATGQERAGEDVLTSVEGTVPGSVVSRVFPSAAPSRSFDVTFWLDDSDRLRRAAVTGPFYGDAPPVSYHLTVQASDAPVKITAP
ncbi:MAG: LppX_LprAFG lipoprotein [Actinomycetota bacterium]|nr:LppX_LprAFG lipoprotein [Actinomycetota bacterium]